MPLERCDTEGKPGWRFGAAGKCYPYTAGDAASEATAKKAAIAQGLAIGGGKAPPEGFIAEAAVVDFVLDLLADDTSAMAAKKKTGKPEAFAFETEDLERVPILKAGGPFHGQGSPPGGTFITPDHLRELVANSRKLVDEYKEVAAANKIGHSDEQKLLVNSGFVGEDEKPAGGWLTNFVVDGDTAYADVKRVPKKLAELIRLGAFRKRSAELKTIVSQTDGKPYRVIHGLGWLGAKAPAVRTLDDIAALYSEDAGDGVVLLWMDEDDPDALFSVNYDPQEGRTMTATPDDTSGMNAKTKLSDDSIVALAKEYEIDEADAGKRRELVEAKLAEELKSEPTAEEKAKLAEEKAVAEKKAAEEKAAAEKAAAEGNLGLSAADVEVLKAKADRGDRVFAERQAEKRAEAIEAALRDGRIVPAKKDFWEEQFKEIDDDKRVIALLEELPPNEEFGRVYGGDENGVTPEDRAKAEDDLYKEYVGFVEGGTD